MEFEHQDYRRVDEFDFSHFAFCSLRWFLKRDPSCILCGHLHISSNTVWSGVKPSTIMVCSLLRRKWCVPAQCNGAVCRSNGVQGTEAVCVIGLPLTMSVCVCVCVFNSSHNDTTSTDLHSQCIHYFTYSRLHITKENQSFFFSFFFTL